MRKRRQKRDFDPNEVYDFVSLADAGLPDVSEEKIEIHPGDTLSFSEKNYLRALVFDLTQSLRALYENLGDRRGVAGGDLCAHELSANLHLGLLDGNHIDDESVLTMNFRIQRPLSARVRNIFNLNKDDVPQERAVQLEGFATNTKSRRVTRFSFPLHDTADAAQKIISQMIDQIIIRHPENAHAYQALIDAKMLEINRQLGHENKDAAPRSSDRGLIGLLSRFEEEFKESHGHYFSEIDFHVDTEKKCFCLKLELKEEFSARSRGSHKACAQYLKVKGDIITGWGIDSRDVLTSLQISNYVGVPAIELKDLSKASAEIFKILCDQGLVNEDEDALREAKDQKFMKRFARTENDRKNRSDRHNGNREAREALKEYAALRLP